MTRQWNYVPKLVAEHGPDIANEFEMGGLTVKELADKYGVSRNSMTVALAMMGFKSPKWAEVRADRHIERRMRINDRTAATVSNS